MTAPRPALRRARADVEPFFFGADGALFGLHHPADAAARRGEGVVLCYPLGHEYLVAHRAFRQLALRLAAAGFDVLRFDYFATGDSAGACERGALSRWLADTHAAMAELRARTRGAPIALVGCRLGAALAACAAAEDGGVERLALWDPVASGRAHVRDVARRHAGMLRRAQVRAEREAAVGGAPEEPAELLGIATPRALLREIERLDLLADARRPAPSVLLVDGGGDPDVARLDAHLARLGARVTRRRVRVPDAWTWIEDPRTVLVPAGVVGAAADWLAGGGA